MKTVLIEKIKIYDKIIPYKNKYFYTDILISTKGEDNAKIYRNARIR